MSTDDPKPIDYQRTAEEWLAKNAVGSYVDNPHNAIRLSNLLQATATEAATAELKAAILLVSMAADTLERRRFIRSECGCSVDTDQARALRQAAESMEKRLGQKAEHGLATPTPPPSPSTPSTRTEEALKNARSEIVELRRQLDLVAGDLSNAYSRSVRARENSLHRFKP